jgi:hypothetical protein
MKNSGLSVRLVGELATEIIALIRAFGVFYTHAQAPTENHENAAD